MDLKYQIVHVMPDGHEHIVGVVNSFMEVKDIVDTAKFAGAWLTETRKLLKYGCGEIRIDLLTKPARISNFRKTQFNYELVIVNDPVLSTIVLDDKSIVGYDVNNKELWRTASFTELCNYVSKEIAYGCFMYYERFLTEFQLPGAI